MRALIAGGGTAGHVYPGLALAAALSARGHEVSFLGTADGLEARLVPEAGYELASVPARPFVREVSVQALRGPATAVSAARTARPLVRGAGVLVGMGGYASVSAVMAARRERVPVVLHEQNTIPGLANRILSRVAAAVAVGFAEAERRFPRGARVVVTGNPVREAVLLVRTERDALAQAARERFELETGRKTVVVFGGSLGALHVDRAAVGACGLLASRADLQVLLITGPPHFEAIRDDLYARGRDGLLVRAEPFVDRMELAYALADVVVARAGAGSVAEIAACGLPSLLIPYPHAVAGEQDANARALQRAGGASVLLDDQLTTESLATRIESLIDHPERLAAMAERSSAFGRPDATERLADLVEEVAR